MAYYPPGREIVLFGGVTPSRHGFQRALGDTWIFDEHGWRRLHPRHSPHPRNGGLMAYDPATRRLLLFGGSAVRGQHERVLFDAWAWNGADWTRLSGVRLPTWMPGAPIAYDPAARRVTELAPRPGCPCSDPGRAFHDSSGAGRVGRWLWAGHSWSWNAEHPAPGTEGGGSSLPGPATRPGQAAARHQRRSNSFAVPAPTESWACTDSRNSTVTESDGLPAKLAMSMPIPPIPYWSRRRRHCH